MRFSFKACLGRAVSLTAISLFTVGLASAATDSYPDKPITVVVPFGAGGTTTTLARLMADELAKKMGETVIVENRPGAGGNIGMDYVARAKPDGYTLLMGPIGLAINPAIYPKLSFDPIHDFAPISLYGGVANILAVSPAVPVTTLTELIAYAKENPGKLTQGSSGNGSSSHLAGEMLRSQAGIDFVHVPYKGGAQAMQDLLAGQISMLFDQVPAVYPHVRAQKVRALGVSTKERSSGAPEIPTIAEQGLPDFEVNVWFGFLAPKGTPRSVIDKVNTNMVAVLNDPDFKTRMTSMGVDTMPSTPEEFQKYLEAETERWGKVAKESGARLE
ncbi:tripartite tricarboxylate transporter substrate binding protein [Alcaligenaceae bacterium]|nr:tripartite tricarboxylate transporter substrate binding protein [Alcaligenaceae bacterium]